MSHNAVKLQLTFRNFFSAMHLSLIKDVAIKRRMNHLHRTGGDIYAQFGEYVTEITGVDFTRDKAKELFIKVAFSRRPSRYTEYFGGDEEATTAFLDWYLETFDTPADEAAFQGSPMLRMRGSLYTTVVNTFGETSTVRGISFDDFDIILEVPNKLPIISGIAEELDTAVGSWLRREGWAKVRPLMQVKVLEVESE